MKVVALKICLFFCLLNSPALYAQVTEQKFPELNKHKLPILYLHKGEELPGKQALVSIKINLDGKVISATIKNEQCSKTRFHKFAQELQFAKIAEPKVVDVTISLQPVTKNARKVEARIDPYNFIFKVRIKRYDSLPHEDCFPPFVKISIGEIKRKN